MFGPSAKFEVLFTEGAEQDLEAIHDYISEFDCVAPRRPLQIPPSVARSNSPRGNDRMEGFYSLAEPFARRLAASLSR